MFSIRCVLFLLITHFLLLRLLFLCLFIERNTSFVFIGLLYAHHYSQYSRLATESARNDINISMPPYLQLWVCFFRTLQSVRAQWWSFVPPTLDCLCGRRPLPALPSSCAQLRSPFTATSTSPSKSTPRPDSPLSLRIILASTYPFRHTLTSLHSSGWSRSHFSQRNYLFRSSPSRVGHMSPRHSLLRLVPQVCAWSHRTPSIRSPYTASAILIERYPVVVFCSCSIRICF
ncbi:hypothetical protein BC835DRAFT_670227 [Cytidiella melzeri]|nr:hypothetical protein BC835DRAFT_670227 [Cytidiella melzeri]